MKTIRALNPHQPGKRTEGGPQDRSQGPLLLTPPTKTPPPPTNAPIRDPASGEFHLEGGAMVLEAADRYFEVSGRRLTFEYVLLAGINVVTPLNWFYPKHFNASRVEKLR